MLGSLVLLSLCGVQRLLTLMLGVSPDDEVEPCSMSHKSTLNWLPRHLEEVPDLDGVVPRPGVIESLDGKAICFPEGLIMFDTARWTTRRGVRLKENARVSFL